MGLSGSGIYEKIILEVEAGLLHYRYHFVSTIRSPTILS